MAKTLNVRTPEEKMTLNTLIRQLEEFRKIDPKMSLSVVMCYLQIAADEGLSLVELYERVGDLEKSGISRSVAILSEGLVNREHGFDLVAAKTSDEERRRKIITLTGKGNRVLNTLVMLSRQLREEPTNANQATRQ